VVQDFVTRLASVTDVHDVAVMVGALLAEIVERTGTPAFHFDLAQTEARLESFLGDGKYAVVIAETGDAKPSGFISLYESYALYAEGTFGTIAELYVCPPYRSHAVGQALLAQAKSLGRARCWSRLEVTTPPLPHFDRTLAFYEREDFAIMGGRKLKTVL